jgi:hypothetical protein
MWRRLTCTPASAPPPCQAGGADAGSLCIRRTPHPNPAAPPTPPHPALLRHCRARAWHCCPAGHPSGAAAAGSAGTVGGARQRSRRHARRGAAAGAAELQPPQRRSPGGPGAAVRWQRQQPAAGAQPGRAGVRGRATPARRLHQQQQQQQHRHQPGSRAVGGGAAAQRIRRRLRGSGGSPAARRGGAEPRRAVAGLLAGQPLLCAHHRSLCGGPHHAGPGGGGHCTGQRGHRVIHGTRGDGTAGWVASRLPCALHRAARAPSHTRAERRWHRRLGGQLPATRPPASCAAGSPPASTPAGWVPTHRQARPWAPSSPRQPTPARPPAAAAGRCRGQAGRPAGALRLPLHLPALHR